MKLERQLSTAREAEQRLLQGFLQGGLQHLNTQAAQESGALNIGLHARSRRGSIPVASAAAAGQPRRASLAASKLDTDRVFMQPQRLASGDLEAALAAAVAARARAPDLAAVREAAVSRRRSLQRQLTNLSKVGLMVNGFVDLWGSAGV